MRYIDVQPSNKPIMPCPVGPEKLSLTEIANLRRWDRWQMTLQELRASSVTFVNMSLYDLQTLADVVKVGDE